MAEEHADDDTVLSSMVDLARDVDTYKDDLTSYGRKMVGLVHKVRGDWDRCFIAFVGFDSETDAFPVGEVRQYWNRAALDKMDEERGKAEDNWRERIYEASRTVIEKFG